MKSIFFASYSFRIQETRFEKLQWKLIHRAYRTVRKSGYTLSKSAKV